MAGFAVLFSPIGQFRCESGVNRIETQILLLNRQKYFNIYQLDKQTTFNIKRQDKRTDFNVKWMDKQTDSKYYTMDGQTYMTDIWTNTYPFNTSKLAAFGSLYMPFGWLLFLEMKRNVCIFMVYLNIFRQTDRQRPYFII